MKIGIFGGTFNPVHQGHVHLAQQCVEELKLDKLLVIPTKQPPHKQVQELASGEHRAQMCRLAFAEIPQAQVSEMELHREGKSYTADTLTQLKQQFPQAQFYLIVGGDMFLTFHQWNRFEEILQGAALCAACRSQDELPKLQQAKGFLEQYSKNLIILKTRVLEISSTQVRAMLHSQEDCSGVLAPAVYRCILENKLYCATEFERQLAEYILLLQKLLKPGRFSHSLNVAQQTELLAKAHGADVKKAKIAGLLHDICKNMPLEEQLHWAKKSDIILDNTILKQPHVWHGFAAAGYLAHELKITDVQIINAVRYHTVARENMSLLEQIVYLADLTSKERDFPSAASLRETVLRSLEEGMLLSLEYTMRQLLDSKSILCLDTCRAYNQYIQL